MAHIVMIKRMNPIGVIDQVWGEWRALSRSDRRAEIHGDLLDKDYRIGDVIQLGGLFLRVIEKDYARLVYIVEQDGFHAWLFAKLNPFRERIDMIYRRTIITLAVWRMARYVSGSYPTWRDVYALDRIAQWLRNKFPGLLRGM